MGPSLGRLGDLDPIGGAPTRMPAAMGPSLGRLGDSAWDVAKELGVHEPQWGRASEGSETECST